MSISTASAKAKGRNHAKATAEIIVEKLSLEPGDIEAKTVSAPGEDLFFSPAARRKLPIAVEAKATKIFPSTGALEQSRANAKGYTPCVVWKPPRKGSSKSLIYFDLKEFLDLWNKKILLDNVQLGSKCEPK